jgi:cellobiose-specific phosphotransferase system component IIB
LAIIGSAYVDIRALDNHLQRDIDNAMKKVKEPLITLQSDVNLTPVREKIKTLRAELKNNPLKFTAEVDDSKIISSLADAHQLYEDNPLNVESHTDTSPMERALEGVRERFNEFHSTVSANANTALAESQLRALTRTRSVGILPKLNIDADLQRAFRGITYTIMGAIPADKVKAAIVEVLANFESLTIGVAKTLTVLGSVSAMALTTGADILTLGADIGRTIGVVSMFPAVMTAFGLTMVALKLGFKGFGEAFSEDAKKASKALAKLPLEAQNAVKALKGLGAEIRKDSQGAFWKEMGTSLQDTVKTAFPIVKQGMNEISISAAKMTKGVLASFKEMAENGQMETLFTNVNKGINAASNAVKPFFDAMNTIAVTGSKHLERYGGNLTRVAEKFDAWATRVSQSGEMDRWITQAGANLVNLGSIVGSTVDVFEGLTQAAAKAGGKSLADLTQGMKNLAGVVNSEPFQSKLVTVLEGARLGVEALSRGFGSIKGVISGGTVALSGFLHLAGQIGGSFLNNIAAMFDGTSLSTGIIEAMAGAKKAMDIMKPAFSDLGNMIGDLGEITGILFVNMAPGFVNLADTLQKVVAALKKGVEEVIPIFNEFIQNILMLMAPIVVGIAKAVGGLLEGFAALPEIVRNGIMAFGLFLAAMKFLDRPLLNTATGVRNLDSPLQKLKDRIRGVRDSLTTAWNTSGTIGAAGGAFSGLASQASVAKDAIGKAFQQIGWMGQHTASAIGEGFKKSFSQLGGELKKLGTPIKEFGSMMGAAMGEALFPQEVRDGFRQVGAKLAEVARIYTGYFTAAKDKIAQIGKSIASVFPASLLGPALKALPGEVAKTLAYAGQKVAEGVTNVAKILAGPQVGYAMQKMKEVIQTQALYASKHLEDIGNGMKAAVETIKGAPAAVAAAVGKMSEAAKAAFGQVQQSMAKAFNSGVLAAAVHPMTAPFVQMADAARTGAIQAAQHISNMAGAIGTAVNNATIPARTAFAGLAVAAGIHAGVMADKFKESAARIGGNISTAFKNAGTDLANVGTNMASTMGRAFTGIQTAATTAATAVSDKMKQAGAKIAENFAPALNAAKGMFDGVRNALSPAVTSIGELGRSAGTAAGAVGQLAGATARWAGSGLLNAMGGGWGLAIAGVTAVITAFADAESKSKARIESFSDSLDKQTGAITGLTKSLMIKSLFDGITNQWDDFVRGVVQGSKTVKETLDKLGVDNKKYLDNMADPAARTKIINAMSEIEKKLRSGQQVSVELADAAGMSVDALTGLSAVDAIGTANSLQHVRNKAEDMAKELKRAEDQIKLVVAVTGVNSAEAAIMSKNYDTLASSTSTVADKFSALKENMSLLSDPAEKAALGQKGYQQSLRDTKTKIEEISKANEGLLLPSLYEVGKGFDFTKQAGADLHSALEGQVDGIQKLGAEAIQKALSEGKKGEEVQRAALTAMQPAIDALKKNLADLGFKPEQIAGIIDGFNLIPKDIKSAVSVTGAEEAMRQVGALKIATDLFVKGDYEATLKVLPDQAKAAIEKATGVANGFKDGNYEAMLKVLDSTEGGRTAALAKLMTVVDGKYDAELTALNLTGPTVEAAKKAGDDFGKQKFSSKMDADTADFEAAKKKAEEEGRLFSGVTYSSKMAADYSLFTEAKSAAEASGQGFAGTTFTSKMASDNAAFEATRSATTTDGLLFGNTTFTSKMAADNGLFNNAKAAATAGGNTFGATTFKTTLDANGQPFSAVHNNATITGSVFGQKTFKPTLDANDLATQKIRNVDSAKIGDKSFSISAFLNDSVENVRRFLGFADGGIVSGAGVQTFANGGITRAVNSYATGGFENHVAQISRGQTPFRVWSEPESGGEAYIPLSKAKRPRSLKILEEVAEQFGFSLVKGLAFANGGLMKSVQADPSPFRTAPKDTTTVVQTPVAASTSGPSVNFHVHPSQGLNETQIGEAAMDHLYWKLSTS